MLLGTLGEDRKLHYLQVFLKFFNNCLSKKILQWESLGVQMVNTISVHGKTDNIKSIANNLLKQVEYLWLREIQLVLQANR